jgi:hypothetical protein
MGLSHFAQSSACDVLLLVGPGLAPASSPSSAAARSPKTTCQMGDSRLWMCLTKNKLLPEALPGNSI